MYNILFWYMISDVNECDVFYIKIELEFSEMWLA